MASTKENELNKAMRKHPYLVTAIASSLFFVFGWAVSQLHIAAAAAGAIVMAAIFLSAWRPGGPGNPYAERPTEDLNMGKILPAVAILVVASIVIAVAMSMAGS